MIIEEIIELNFPMSNYKSFLTHLENKGVLKLESNYFRIVGTSLKIREDYILKDYLIIDSNYNGIATLRKKNLAKDWSTLNLQKLDKQGEELDKLFEESLK